MEEMSTPTSATTIRRRIRAMEVEGSGEHISMSGMNAVTGVEEETASIKPQVVRSELLLSNRIRKTYFSFTIYVEGFLKVREWRRQELVKDYMIALRFLNAEPDVTGGISMRAVGAAILFAGLAVATAVLSLLTPWAAELGLATLALGVASATTLAHVAVGTEETAAFSTAVGGCEVLRITGTIDSLDSARQIVPQIAEAIDRAHGTNPPDTQRYLREEMHEHYQLREQGAISLDECSEATRIIIAKFE